jgi:hypothetical protein
MSAIASGPNAEGPDGAANDPNSGRPGHGLPTPPSSLRVVRVLAGVGLARLWNRMDALRNWKKKPDPKATADSKAARVATGPKRNRRLLAWVWSIFMFFGFVMLCAGFVQRLSHHVDPSTKGTPVKVDMEAAAVDKQSEQEVRYENSSVWPKPEFERPMVAILGLVCLTLGTALLLFTLCGNQDLGKVEWDLEWLFTLPVSARPLFVARAMPLAFAGFSGFLPLFVVIYCSCGYGAWGLLLAVPAAAYVGILIGFLCVFGDIWFHKRLAPALRKNVQAILSLIASVGLFLVMIVATSGDWLFPYFGYVADAMSGFALWNPFSAPVALSRQGPPSLTGAAVMVGYAIAVPWICVELSARMVRHGLISQSGAYQGTHGKPAQASRRRWSGGIVGKELLLLRRDQNYLSQTLILPIIVFIFNMAMIGGMWQKATTDVHNAAAISFGLGAYLLMMSSSRVLASEGNTFWLLYTFPQALHSMLLRKTQLWCGFALLYTSLSMAVLGWFGLAREPDFFVEWVAALVGIVVYAFILSGIGVLGTEPNENGAWRQGTELTYLNLILILLFTGALYAPGVWPKIVQAILCGALALAIWQRVQQQLPYLLDQSLTSPPQITLIDGLIAVVAFFSIQSGARGLIAFAEMTLAKAMTFAFVAAGAAVVLSFVVVLRQKKVPHLLETLRLKAPAGVGAKRLAREFLIAAAAGIAIGICGSLYMLALVQVEAIRTLLRQVPLYGLSFASSDFWWMVILLVVAAPLFEEFIFRSLIHQSLRNTFRAVPAMAISAAIFAIVHPPISVAPVFLLGLAAAWSLERSSFLGTSMVVHMTYNAVVVAASRWIV